MNKSNNFAASFKLCSHSHKEFKSKYYLIQNRLINIMKNLITMNKTSILIQINNNYTSNKQNNTDNTLNKYFLNFLIFNNACNMVTFSTTLPQNSSTLNKSNNKTETYSTKQTSNSNSNSTSSSKKSMSLQSSRTKTPHSRNSNNYTIRTKPHKQKDQTDL